MISIEETNDLLDEVAAEIPADLFRDLNGGVSLLPSVKYHEASDDGSLLIMGEYCHDQMGRYIMLYYGSIARGYAHQSPAELRETLKKLLLHELTHHLESLAGERGLEIKDEQKLDGLLRKRREQSE